MRRYLLHLSYFGTRYRGFQKQNIDGTVKYDDPHTICGLLEIALKGLTPANHPIVIPSSRTDKGVHALSNTIHVDLDCSEDILDENITFQLNKFFEFNDHDIRILSTQQVANDFSCRYSVYERRYMYRIAVPKAGLAFHHKYLVPSPLTEYKRCFFVTDSSFDAEATKSACKIFVGVKDFAALTTKTRDRRKKNKTTVRNVQRFELVTGAPLIPSVQLTEQFDFWNFNCVGKSFLYHQVRRMVAAVIAYGRGKVTLSDVQKLIDEPVEDSWKSNFQMVPPCGLYLTDVLYYPKDLLLPEELKPKSVEDKLEEERKQILQELKNYKTSISEKINLRKRLLEISDEIPAR